VARAAAVRTGTRYRQFCALARAAEIVGERWTLLIVRELLLGPKRFSDLRDRLHGITPAVLVTRLAAMTGADLIRSVALPPPARSRAYELTDLGAALKPAVLELVRWGGAFLFPLRKGDECEPEWALLALEAIARRSPSPKVRIRLRIRESDKSCELLVTGGPQGTRVERGGDRADAEAELSLAALLRIVGGALDVREAKATGQLEATGSLRALRDLPMLFDPRSVPRAAS
jgi:DNA-binding HxlR family transcriptional regulator